MSCLDAGVNFAIAIVVPCRVKSSSAENVKGGCKDKWLQRHKTSAGGGRGSVEGVDASSIIIYRLMEPEILQ